MTTITFAEIAQFRSDLAQLTDYPDALGALDEVEDCEGDVEDAAIVLALQSGMEPNRSEQMLEGLAKRWRPIICQDAVMEPLTAGSIAPLVALLAEDESLPVQLIALVAIYVVKTGVSEFCHSQP